MATVTNQIAKKETTDDGTVTRDTYYLVAQWEVGNYTLRFDANGGSLGRTNKIENVAYNTAISEPSLSLPISGSFAPTRPGHFFLGWSEEKVAPSANDADFDGKIFAASSLKPTGVALAATPKMPESDKTVYAVWKIDTSKTLVTFDTGEGGSPIKDQAYGAAETTYTAPFNPTRPGYTFDGWFMPTIWAAMLVSRIRVLVRPSPQVCVAVRLSLLPNGRPTQTRATPSITT